LQIDLSDQGLKRLGYESWGGLNTLNLMLKHCLGKLELRDFRFTFSWGRCTSCNA
jgi:hypothetical protein